MNDLAIHLTDENGKHLYEQIYEYIADEIREGKLLSGEKLPSTRSLAEYLQVARSTVELAYDQLASEGYIESVPYRGYYICRVEELYRIGASGSGERESASGKTGRTQGHERKRSQDRARENPAEWRRMEPEAGKRAACRTGTGALTSIFPQMPSI